jgi:glyoxylase-like metal-dependent hydrolase (beta-lactamase superfamily II)/rhodanese-related sulfurtransferase
MSMRGWVDGRGQLPEVGAAEVAARLGTEGAPVLVDVREPEEFVAWSIPGARNIPLGELGTRLAEVPTDADVVVVCASGARSSRAVAALRSAGLPAVNLAGGMLAWAGVYDTADLILGPVTVVQVRRRSKGCLSYVVGAGDEAFVVDPSLDLDEYRQVAADRNWRITRVFDTHLHADHVSGARALAEATGASLHLNPADPFDFPFEPLVDGQRLPLGGTTTFGVTAFTTPGHTRGSAVFDVGGVALLTGDTLFVDGVGRPDLADRAEEFARDLHRSLHTKVVSLPADTLVLPSHHGEAVAVAPGRVVGATLDELRLTVPQLTWSEEEFVAWAAGRATPRPPHYADIIRINMAAGAASEDVRQLELGPNRCSA